MPVFMMAPRLSLAAGSLTWLRAAQAIGGKDGVTMVFRMIAGVAVAGCMLAGTARAADGPVGERHLSAMVQSATLRDAGHGAGVRVTVWYPAAKGAKEKSIDLGPGGQVFFREGASAADADFPDRKLRPVILLSHGFGGTAGIMAWLALPLARAGYVVVAVDHPGNNGRDTMTAAGATLFWERAVDLAAALKAAKADPVIGPHLDNTNVGLAGFSIGGFTALVGAGARAAPARLFEFCAANPEDAICQPQKEFALSMAEAQALLASPEFAGAAARAGENYRIPAVRGVFAIAPAMVQELVPGSLSRLAMPVAILLGDADKVVPPSTNGLAAAKAIPGAQVKVLPGVGHYDFLGTCTDAGRAGSPLCAATVPQDRTHKAAIDMALAFFGKTLGKP
jgi:predicted dienelactone hydrolase